MISVVIRKAALVAGLVVVLAASSATAAEVVVFRLDDNIHPASGAYLERCLADARASAAELVVVELDTPGGLVDATRDITSAITSSPVPVVVWVAPAGARAASAGFFILIAADVAAMAPGTNTGAATPVLMPMIPTGSDAEPSEEMKAKVTSDVSAMLRSFAAPRGRNVDLAVRAVTEALSFTAEEALESGLVDLVAPTLEDLLESLDGRTVTRMDGTEVVLDLSPATVTRFEPSGLERFRSTLAQPLVAFLLMAIAAIGIYTEITTPGAILPGVVGAIALLLFLYSTLVLPVNWLAAGLIALALVLFVLEVKVASYGLLTAAGLVCFVLGALMLFDTPIPAMRLSLAAVLPTAAVVALVMVVLLQRVLAAYRNPVATGREGLVGDIGRAIGDLAPNGKVVVHGEYWDARATAGEARAGSAVRVVRVLDRRLDVEPVDDGRT